MVQPSRINSQELQHAADVAKRRLDEAYAALDKFLDLLTPEERKSLANPPFAFIDAAKTLARAVADHPVIASATQYDPSAVLEDLKNVEILAPVVERVTHISQLLADARLAWLHEAYIPSLQVYGVAKVVAKSNAEVQKVLAPLARVFSLGSRRTQKTD